MEGLLNKWIVGSWFLNLLVDGRGKEVMVVEISGAVNGEGGGR